MLMDYITTGFIPLFIAIDIFAVLPIYSSLTTNTTKEDKKAIILKSVITSMVFGTIFLFFGTKLFNFLGITQFDFQVGGGILIFCIALSDLLFGGFENRRKGSATELGIVPLAIPLILGPASLTTLLIISNQHGKSITLVSLFVNIALVGIVLLFAEKIIKILGEGFNLALAKIVSLFLLAISVMMIRSGIEGIMNLN